MAMITPAAQITRPVFASPSSTDSRSDLPSACAHQPIMSRQNEALSHLAAVASGHCAMRWCTHAELDNAADEKDVVVQGEPDHDGESHHRDEPAQLRAAGLDRGGRERREIRKLEGAIL